MDRIYRIVKSYGGKKEIRLLPENFWLIVEIESKLNDNRLVTVKFDEKENIMIYELEVW